MEATELRVGNWVTCFSTQPDKINEPIQVNYIAPTKDGDMAVYFNDGWGALELIEPIPLTEDILIRLGFEKEGHNWIIGDMFVRFWIHWEVWRATGESWERWVCGQTHLDKFEVYDLASNSIKYVHQVQNLYYALTGKELTFK